MKFQIDYMILKGLSVLTAKKDVRFYLNGINVEINQHGAYFIATDGHKMGIWHDSEITSENPITHTIPNTLLEQVSKVVKGNITLVDIELSPMIEITYLNNTFKAPAIDGTYPDFRRVIPETITHEIAQFDPEYLMQFKKCASIINNVKSPDVAIGFNGHSGSIVDIQNGKFLGVIMPYRSNADFTNYQKPIWIDYQPRPEVLKAVA